MSNKVGKVQKKSGHLQAGVTTCWDVSAVDVVNKHGKSVIDKKKRPNRGSTYLTLRQDGKTWYVVREWDGRRSAEAAARRAWRLAVSSASMVLGSDRRRLRRRRRWLPQAQSRQRKLHCESDSSGEEQRLEKR